MGPNPVVTPLLSAFCFLLSAFCFLLFCFLFIPYFPALCTMERCNPFTINYLRTLLRPTEG